ncbi:MAG: hypothetical protein AMJ46_04205 [Latescibacteria bacterium DG_63]|nr:MAG: hypothetical protein AMJ46_04205 [Latescibacteria bacterium DG_63]
MFKMKHSAREVAFPAAQLVVLLICLFAANYVQAQEYELRNLVFQTEGFRIFYNFKEHDYILDHLARCGENSLRYHKTFFRYEPSEEVTVYFNDLDDYGYAGTTTIPNNWLTLGIEPFEYVYDTCPTNERMNWVMNHELVHVVASDQATRGDKLFRRVFSGKVTPTDEDPVSIFYSYLTNPRRYAPRWYHEGIAVFMETWMAGGLGRSLTGYDEMTFRAMVRDNSHFYDIVGLESEGTAKDFQIGQNSYLYGTRFFSYLACQYGPEKVIEWVRRGEGSKRYFSSQFKNVYGVPLDEEWSRWIQFEHGWQENNLRTIRENAPTPYRVLSCRPLGSVSREFFDPDSRILYAAINYPGEFAHIAAINIDTGEIRKICEIPTPALYYVTSLACDDSSSTLFFTTDNSRSWRDINAVDIRTGKKRVLLKNFRTGDLVFNRSDKSLWGVQHDNGRSSLVQFPPPYEDGYKVMTLKYGKDIFDIDISPDGKYLTASLSEINGTVRLIRMEIEKLLLMDEAYDVLWEFKHNAPANFVYSPDGSYLFGTSYYTGASNVWRYDFENQTMKPISNCETGFFRPLPVSEDSLIAFRYTGKGFVPILIPNKPIEDVGGVKYLGQEVVNRHPEVRNWVLGSPLEIDLDSVLVARGEYSVVRHLGLSSAYPIAEGYKDHTSCGVRLNLMDPVMLNSLDVALSYSPTSRLSKDERAHLRFKYRYMFWTLSGAYNRADFYDFFGPTKVSRKGYSLALNYDRPLIYNKPRTLEYTIDVAGYGGLERLPEFQNIATSFDEFYTASAELRYKNTLKTIGGVEHEKGLSWKVTSDNSYVKSTIYPLVHADFDYGLLLPVDHTSLWLRTSLGHSFGEREEPFANFYFGGFGNNWVDHAEIDRYREFYSFPGVELNEVAGKNYGKVTLELVLPPIRFQRFGVPALYCNWTRLALFSSGIITNVDSRAHRRELVDVGAQLNFKLVLFSSLESTLSFGYAVAAEEGTSPTDELMVSLKILR